MSCTLVRKCWRASHSCQRVEQEVVNNSFVVLIRRQHICLQGGTSRNVRLRVVNPAPRNAAVTQPGPTSTERTLPDPSSQHGDAPAASSTHVQPEQQLSESQQQKQPLPLLLSGLNIPATTISLPIHPAPGSLQIWQTHQNNHLFYPARLFGNAEHPGVFVGLGAHELLCHSQWAAKRLQQASTDSASLHLVLPVRTEQETVCKLVEALYSRSLSLANGAEQMLMLAHSIQVGGAVFIRVVPAVACACNPPASASAWTFSLHGNVMYYAVPFVAL